MISLVDVLSSELEPQTNNLVINSSSADQPFSGELFGTLGITSRPYGADDNGSAEAIVLESPEVYLGMRDSRVGNSYGAIDPGDTVLHSTHPNESVQIQMKGEARQAVMMAFKANNKPLGVSLSGTSEEVLVFGNGCSLKFNKDGSFSLLSRSGTGIIADAQGVWIKGGSVKLGANPVQPMNLLTTPPGTLTTPETPSGAPLTVLPTPFANFPSSIFVTP